MRVLGGWRVGVATLVALALVGAPAAGDELPDASHLYGPVGLTVGSDRALWVADYYGVMRVTLDGRFARIVRSDGINGITRGPDGAVWFTEQEPDRIGRIAADGSVSYFSAGITQSPVAITAGPDGNLWFTEFSAIGRITPSGVITEFDKPQVTPASITAGRDGNVWFGDRNGRIGRVTPAGSIKEFGVPPADASVDAVATGRDGSLWYGVDGYIGRMTTAGRARLFKVPFESVLGIALGSDGDMWVAGAIGGPVGAAILRVTPRGKVRLFRNGLSGYDTAAIVSGPGRALSIAEDGRTADAIARMSTTGAVRELPPAPPCVVPSVKRRPLASVEDVVFGAECQLDPRSRRAGKQRGTVALGISPKPGTVLPFNTSVRVRFGPVPPLPRRCRRPFGGRRLASSSRVLVFSYTDYDPEFTDESTTHYVACLRPHGRLHAITSADASDESTEVAAGFTAAGDFVAYNLEGYGKYGDGFRELRLYDVRHARQLFDLSVDEYSGLSSPSPTDSRLGEYVVSEHGAIAWLSLEGPTTRLFARPHAGGVRELDSAPSLSGLSFSGDTLSWTSGSGERKSVDVR